MLADITITSSGFAMVIGWISLGGLVGCALGWLTVAKCRFKCDDWVTPLIVMAAANISGIIGIIFGLIWIGSKL